MADIHIKVTQDGVYLWRTQLSPSGTRVRVQGLATHLASLKDVRSELQVLQPRAHLAAQSGVSNDNHNFG